MKISIVTPTLNAEQYIRETLDSIHSQDYDDFEHIIVDGCSTDGTLDIIKEFIDDKGHERIILIQKDDNNMYEAINTGLRQISGDIFAYLNADDCYVRETFNIVASAFNRYADVDMIYGNCQYIDAEGNTLFWSNNPKFSYKRLVRAKTAWIQQPCTFYRRRVLDEVGYFDESYDFASDYQYLLRVGQKCKVRRVKDAVVKFRVHPETISQTNYDRMMSEAERISKLYVTYESYLATKLLTLMDYFYIYARLIRPKNFGYIIKKLVNQFPS
jgi:glycosyltransferase involved in cell wall biosynthesis